MCDCLYLGPADRAELEALSTDRNTPHKLAWRAGIVLATADGAGTVETMRRTSMSKPTVPLAPVPRLRPA